MRVIDASVRRRFAMTTLLISIAGVPAGALQPIGPKQHFAGLVNGKRTSAVVYTVYTGPASPGRTGPVAGGQTLSVVRTRRGHGYTGPFTQIYT